MKRRDKHLYLLLAVLLIAPYLIVGAMDAGPAVPEDKPRVISVGTHEVEPTLHPTENELIEAALLEQGYFSDAIPLTYELQDITRTACEEFSVPYVLALAVMEQESGFEVDAVGRDGHDIGLFQLRDAYHWWLTEQTGADPMTTDGNIRCGVWLIGYHMGRHETAEGALTAYRWGHDNGERGYAKEVMERVSKWKSVFGQ